MPFLIVIGAAYAAYQANANSQKDDEKIKIDPSINVRGKEVVQLHELEREMSILELPIGSISFFEGDYKAAAAHLERRVEEILKANPWLGGRLLPMPDLQVVYDPKGEDRPPGIFQAFEPGIIPLKHSTPYEMHSEMLHGAVVPRNDKTVGQNQPLWRVSVIPDVGEWETKFAVAVSMSHAIGDAHTYYKFYNMLHCEAPVEAMNPTRIANYKEAVHEYVGEPGSTFVEKIVSAMATTTKPMHPKECVAKLSFEQAPLKKNATKKQPATKSLEPKQVVQQLSFEPTKGGEDTSPLLKSFKQHQIEVFAEENVCKMFYVNEEWVMRRKGRRGSVFEADTAGNSSVATASAALTANSIIASWFFRMNEAGIGILMMNMRQRLSKCVIGERDAGKLLMRLSSFFH